MQQIWQQFLSIIKKEVGNQVVETWFKAVSVQNWDKDKETIFLNAPNQFVKSWIKEHYIILITKHLKNLLNIENINIEILSPSVNINKSKNIIPASIIQPHEKKEHEQLESKNEINTKKTYNLPATKININKFDNLNSAYDFDHFVVGPNNSLAHAAGYAICQNLGCVYNPLFIYGSTGLGKTHLLHAIGNEVKSKDPSKIILYQTTDKFTTEFIHAIRLDKVMYFRQKYQKIDLLLLDDIQFLSNKEQTQEMFFHIFNLLYEGKKQIILSSDTFPKEIRGLQDRLKSRLEWGLVVDIQMPDLETKIAILEKKAEQHSLNLTEDVANFIASRITSNIRELEGALIRVGAFSTLTNKIMSLELAKRVLLNLNENNNRKGIMLDKIMKTIADYYDISISDLKSKNRHKNIAMVRQVSFYLMKKLTFCSLQTIGEFVGKRDHSTVLHSISKVELFLEKDRDFAKRINVIEQKILMS
ncbi:MAG: chromosomal replication initiator protein DnaA [bacterium]